MSISEIIGDFLTPGPNGDKSYTVTRTLAGPITNGRYAPGAASTFPIFASVQSTNGRDLKALAEAQITTESRIVLTTTELQGRTDDTEPDTIEIEADGVPWTVFECTPCPDLEGGVYFRGVVARQSMR